MIACTVFLSTTRSGLLALLCACASWPLAAQEGSLDPSFNPTDVGSAFGDGANDQVLATVLQPDGRIIIGGYLTSYQNTVRNRIARLNADGTLDPAFNPGSGANSDVRAINLQPDGRVVIGGLFTSYNGTSRSRIARLSQDASLDATFDPGAGPNSYVYATALQSDGKIIIGGEFTSCSGTPRSKIARLNTDGSLDLSFDPALGANVFVYCIALQPDGKVIIGGNFTSYNGTTRNRIARLNTDGSLDASFNPGTGANAVVDHLALQSDGKVIIGGLFTNYNGTSRGRLARLNADGSLDTSFDIGSGANAEIQCTAVQLDGKVLVSGAFTSFNGTSHNHIARLHADGGVDASFNSGSGANSGIVGMTMQQDGKVIIGGAFLDYNGTAHNRIARLNADGSPDASFDQGHGANGLIYAPLTQPDGKIIIGGQFNGFNGTVRNKMARLNADGGLDASFAPGTGADYPSYYYVLATALQPDGKILITGIFASYNGTARNNIARSNSNGSLDASFDPGSGTNNRIRAIALQPDGKIIIAGDFTTYNGTARNRIARLNADGSLDATFNPGAGPDSYVHSIGLQPDGKILIVGTFTSYNGTIRNRVARLNSAGGLDASFNPGSGASSDVHSLALQPDGRIIISGLFINYNGTARSRVARLNSDGGLDLSFDPGSGANGLVGTTALQPDGKIIIGGQFTSYDGTPRSRIARLNADGGLDVSFDPGSGANNTISSIAVRSDGGIIISGSFTSYNGIGRNRIARINGTPHAGIKVMLEGPYSGGTMNDALRTLPSFPLTEPFTSMGYMETGSVSGATIGASVLTTTGNNAVVDWVIVEMRPVATPGTVAASRTVLLQRDGDVVDLDGVSTVGFAGLAPGNYCVAVKPRNHLPVMLSPSTPISYGASGAAVDFTLSSTQVYDNDARKNVGGVMVLAAGDVTFNETVAYTGLNNDRDPILIRVGSTTPNNTVSGYWREDVNMDGTVKYTGSANDRDIILTNVGSTTPNNTRVATLP